VQDFIGGGDRADGGAAFQSFEGRDRSIPIPGRKNSRGSIPQTWRSNASSGLARGTRRPAHRLAARTDVLDWEQLFSDEAGMISQRTTLGAKFRVAILTFLHRDGARPITAQRGQIGRGDRRGRSATGPGQRC